MFLDNLATFLNNTSIVSSVAAVAAVGDQIDLRDLGGDYTSNLGYNRDLGLAPLPLWFYCAVGTTGITGAVNSAAVTLELVTASNEALTSDVTVLWSKAATVGTSGAGYTAGTRLAQLMLPSLNPTYQRYIGMRQTTATQAVDAGTLNAFLMLSPKAWRATNAETGI